MNPHFVDAGAFIAEMIHKDQYHQQALLIAEQIQKENSEGITTDAVLYRFQLRMS